MSRGTDLQSLALKETVICNLKNVLFEVHVVERIRRFVVIKFKKIKKLMCGAEAKLSLG